MRVRIKGEVHFQFWILLTVLIIMLFLRYAFQVDIPRIVLTAIIAIIAFRGNLTEIIAIAMCCIPLHEAVDLYYSIISCMLAMVMKYPKRIRLGGIVILILTMVVWELLHCFEATFSFMTFLISTIPLLLLMLILCIDISEIEYGFVTRTTAIVLVSMCITLLVGLIIKANYNVIIAFSNLRRLGLASEGETMLGGEINPNSLGIMCVLLLTACLQLRTIEQNKKIDMFLMPILLIFGTLTASRTFFICLILTVVLIIMAQKGTVTKRIKFLISITIFTLVTLLLLYYFFPDLMEYYVNRFKVDDITTGRDKLMQAYHNYIISNPKVLFWGIGLNYYGEKLTLIYRIASNYPHNCIQEIVIAWGIPGLIMFMTLCIAMIRKSKKYCDDKELLNYIPFVIIISKSMAGQLLTSSYSMLALGFAYLSLCQNWFINMKTHQK